MAGKFVRNFCAALFLAAWAWCFPEPHRGVGEDVPVQEELKFLGQETLRSGIGVKCVLMSPGGEKVYSVNLEQMDVVEFNRATRRVSRRLAFVPSPGKGWDYQKNAPIDSLQEKPVEACFSHQGKYLWISLHNADGVVAWDLEGGSSAVGGLPFKEAHVYDGDGKRKEKVRLIWIKTGKTPKVMAATRDGKYLFVTNWHSNSLSVIDIQSPDPSGWKTVKTLRNLKVPRGLALSDDGKELYITEMGGDGIRVLDVEKLEYSRFLQTGFNPRHVVVSGDDLFLSLNSGAKLLKINRLSGKTARVATTRDAPRTIILTPDKRFVVVTCYYGDCVQVFSSGDLALKGEFESKIHPVAVDAHEEGGLLEAWVGNYTSGTLSVLSLYVQFRPEKGADVQ